MDHQAGIDVSLETSSICVVDASGRRGRRAKASCRDDYFILYGDLVIQTEYTKA